MSKFNVGQVWVTRDGRKARIVATDMKSNDPIAAIVEDHDGSESVRAYYPDGKFYSDDQMDCDLIREHREPREWWVNVYEDGGNGDALGSREECDKVAGLGRTECIRVREVIE